MTENSVLKSYENYLTNVKNRSENTVKAYIRAIQEFEKWYSQSYNADAAYSKITKQQLVAYTEHLAEQGKSPATRCQKVSAIKTFFAWLTKTERISEDVSAVLEAPSLEKKAPKTMTDFDVCAVLEACQHIEKSESGKVAHRNFVILYMFLNCGLRKSELINLKLCDVDTENNCALVHGKGNKQRYVYFNDDLKSALNEYIGKYRPKFKTAGSSEYLFVSSKGSQLTATQVKYIFDRLLKKSGLEEKGYTVHTLRKTCATLLYKGGTDVSTIKELLGHGDVKTTYIYLAIPEENKRVAGTKMEIKM